MARIDKWLELNCSECGRTFQFPQCAYKPETCANPECLKVHLHPELKKGVVK